MEFWVITKTFQSSGDLNVTLESSMDQDEVDVVTLVDKNVTGTGKTVDEVTSSVGQWGRVKVTFNAASGGVISVWVVPKRS